MQIIEKEMSPALASVFLTHFESKQQMKDWIFTFLDLDFPDSYIDPDSNSSPIDWMWNVYQIYKKNEGNKFPSIIVISSRESFKTLSEAVWGVIGMVHFKTSLAHMAAIVPQAGQAQKYVQDFFRKIRPYLEYHNIALNSQNSKEISLKYPDGSLEYMKIIVCSVTGANSFHSNLFCVSGKTLILVENYRPHIAKRKRIKIQASKLFKELSDGKQIKIVSFNHSTGMIELKPIIASFNNGIRPLVDVEFSDGSISTVTPDHKFFTDKGYLPISELIGEDVYYLGKVKTGDQNRNCQAVRCKTLHKIKVISIRPAIYNRKCYDFTVADNHNYFADNLLVHNCIDEIDTIRSAEGLRSYQESQAIPGIFNGKFPITIKTSTMKFPGGLFSKEIDKAKEKSWPIYRWNILDITEHCPSDRCRPDLPKAIRYVRYDLPLLTMVASQYETLTDKEKEQFTEIECMGGCASCQILPICQGRLHYRPQKDKGGLWKPIDFTIAQFNKFDPDMAEAQLLCRRPSTAGLVYPRFLDKDDGTGNVYTLDQAWEVYTGTKKTGVTLEGLIKELIKNGAVFHIGGDWGHVNAFALVVGLILPNKEFWLIDNYSISGLELEQMLDLAITVRDRYNKPRAWYMDTNQPMFRKLFTKNKMPCPDFKKDIMGGIEAIRGQIIDAKGRRRLKVIKHQRNAWLIKMFKEHCFMLDSLGNLTQEPDSSEVADSADSTRYLGQNLFKPSSKPTVATMPEDTQPQTTELNDWTKLIPDRDSFASQEILADFGADL